MSMTNFMNGVAAYGIPLMGTFPAQIPRVGLSIPTATGAVYFVDNVNGSDSNDGLNVNTAFSTIQKALGKSITDGGTTIYVFETGTDYAENLLVTVKGVTIVGVSTSGNQITNSPASGIPLRVRGGLTQGATTRAHNFSCFNMDFNSQDTSAACQQQANRFLYNNCRFESASGIGLRLLPNNLNNSESASEGVIANCTIRQSSVGMTYENPGPSAGGTGGTGVTGTVLRSCIFYGNANQDIKDVDTAGSNDACFGATGSPTENCLVTDCDFMDRAKAVYITLTNGGINCGSISNCRFAMDGVGRLTSTQVAIATAVVAYEIYDSTGLVDAHAF